MSGAESVDPRASVALERACIEALAAADVLALGAVRAGVLVHASTALGRLFGLREAGPGVALAELIAPFDRERVAAALAAPGGATVAFRAVRADGSLFEAELRAVPVALPDGPAAVVALFDRSERQSAARPLSYLALVDPVTGLANRSAFLERLHSALNGARRSGRPSVALLVELEGIDSEEPGTHDALLQTVATRLQRCVRETDLVARLGPAQFAVVLARVDERSHAALPAARMLAALAEPIDSAAGCRASIGIAAYPNDAGSAEALLERAQAALAGARAAGGGRFGFAVPEEVSGAPMPVYVSWNPRLAVGVEVLDGQHQELLDLINRLGDGLRSGRDFDELVEALKDLVRYTEHHFATEERLMDELGLRSERHRSEHRRLLESLMGFTLRLDADGVSHSAGFLQDWLFRHIDEVDRPFAASLRHHGQR